MTELNQKVFSYNEAIKASKEYFNGEELAAKVFVDKYALRDFDNNLLEKTPTDMHKRLAREFARIEKKKFANPLTEDQLFQLFDRFSQVIPQGSPLYGIGNNHQYISISNCFVVKPPDDSYGDILRADEELIQISKRRGGVGIDISELRPTGFTTKNSSKSSSGTASWMQRYSNSIREVGQDGRRGALMITMNVHHPDIEIFATIKNDDTKVTGANISVKLTDEFLKAVENNEEYEQRWPIEGTPKFSRKVSARKVWNTIIHSAWFRAEPGLLFWDNILRDSPADCYASLGFKTVATNPCSELPLSINDSCRLLAIVLMACVENPYTSKASFNYQKLFDLAKVSQRLMDDLVDLEIECIDRILEKIESDPPVSKQRERLLWQSIRNACVNGRRTGLGITGLGDTIAALGVQYGSDESIAIVDRIYKTLKFGSYTSSVEMAKELGPFPAWDWELEKDNPFINRMKEEFVLLREPENTGYWVDVLNGHNLVSDIEKYGRRNIANLTTAPTGSISIMASMVINNKHYHNIDSGIEPTLFVEAVRKKKGNLKDDGFRVDSVDQSGDKWMHFTVYHSGVRAWMDVNNKTEIDDTCPYKGSLASEINWKQRVFLQAAAQRHVDHAISSTINLPSNVTEQEVAEIYEASWKHNLKGITVYREGCRSGVIVQKDQPKAKDTGRPKEVICDIHHITVKGIKYFVLVGLVNDKPYEVFAGKNGFLDKEIKQAKITKKRNGVYHLLSLDGEEVYLAPITQACSEDEEAITRLSSLCLRSGADMHLVVKQLEQVGGDMMSFAKSVARALKKYIPDGTHEGEKCPECGDDLIRSEGCKKCNSCGYSACA